MPTIPQQEAEDLANSLPFDQSQLWGSAIFMVGVIAFTLWVLNRNDGTPKQLPTLLEVEAKRDLNSETNKSLVSFRRVLRCRAGRQLVESVGSLVRLTRLFVGTYLDWVASMAGLL